VDAKPSRIILCRV